MTQQNQCPLQESDIAFRTQFNPEHPNYHAGDPTPVPIGGARVPDGCDEAPAEGSSSVPLAALPADYHSVQVERELVGKVKTEISVASKAIGALHAASAANRTVTKEEEEVKAALSQLDKLVTEYKEKQTEDSTDVVVRVVGQMVAMCATVPASKEEYGEFVLSVQRLTGQLFKEQGRLLQEMKDIKKAATTNVEAPAAS